MTETGARTPAFPRGLRGSLPERAILDSQKGHMMSRKKEKKPIPEPVSQYRADCFGVAFFDNEADALDYEKRWVKAYDRRYVGGYMHDVPCGREKHRDRTAEDGRHLYAVTY